MKKEDFLRIVGAGNGVEYAPVAGMLRNGYGFAGYFNSQLNQGMEETFVLLNARLVNIRRDTESRTPPRLSDFGEFVEEIVMENYQSSDEPKLPRSDVYGKSIPLAAIPLNELSVVYPVGHIGRMMQTIEKEQNTIPSFLDFDNKSLLLKLLRTKLW